MNLHGSNPAKNTANTVFRIRIGFNADPDPAFYLNADPDPDPNPGSQTNADPCGSGSRSWSDFAVTKSKILHKKYTLSRVIGLKTYLRWYKSFLERLKIRFTCLFWLISLLLDPDPHSQYRYGSGSGSKGAKSMRIHADPKYCKKLRIFFTPESGSGSTL